MPKRVGNATYVHKLAVDELPYRDRNRVWAAETLVPDFVYSVVRVRPKDVMFGRTTSFHDPHPELLESVLVHTDTRKADPPRLYNPDNPPIYHRKEQMLPPLLGAGPHPHFATLTAAEEAAGLLGRPDIGTKKSWERVLAQEGYAVVDHELRRRLPAKKGGSRAVDLDAILGRMLTEPQSVVTQDAGAVTQDVSALVALVMGRSPTRQPTSTAVHAQVQGLVGQGPDPMGAWLRLVKQVKGLKQAPLKMDGWTEAQRSAVQDFVPDLRWYDVIFVNSSGGKDSINISYRLVQLAKEQGVFDRLVMIHADLGFVEWIGTRELVEEHARDLGMPIHIVTKNVDLPTRILAGGLWPAGGPARFCTGEFKEKPIKSLASRIVGEITGVSSANQSLIRADNKRRHEAAIDKMAEYERRGKTQTRAYRDEVEKRDKYALLLDLRPVRFLNVLGLRAAEGGKHGDRWKKIPFIRKVSSSRFVYDTWLPIHGLSEEVVKKVMRQGPLRAPESYACGMTRHSCVFCVMANKGDLVNAAILNPELLGRYAQLQKEMTDPRINPWDGDQLTVRGKPWIVVQRDKSTQPHQVRFRIAGGSVQALALPAWRKATRKGSVVELGKGMYLRKRYFTSRPLAEIAFLGNMLRNQGANPRVDPKGVGRKIEALLKDWTIVRRKAKYHLESPSWNPRADLDTALANTRGELRVVNDQIDQRQRQGRAPTKDLREKHEKLTYYMSRLIELQSLAKT